MSAPLAAMEECLRLGVRTDDGSLRQLLGKGRNLSHIIHFGAEQVFAGATTYTCLLFLTKKPQPKFSFVKVANLAEWRTKGEWENDFGAGRSSRGRTRYRTPPATWNRFLLADVEGQRFARSDVDCTGQVFDSERSSAGSISEEVLVLPGLEQTARRSQVLSKHDPAYSGRR